MKIQALFFASLRDALGVESAELELAEGAIVSDALEALSQRYPELESARASLAVAVNAVFARPETPLHEGDELALIPPVSGG